MRGLGRRRGAASSTRSDRAWTTTMLIGLIIAMITTAMILGLLLGTQLWSSHGRTASQQQQLQQHVSVDQLLVKPHIRGAVADTTGSVKPKRIVDGASSEVAKPQAQNVPPVKDEAAAAEGDPDNVDTDDVEKVNPGIGVEGEDEEEEEKEGQQNKPKPSDDVQQETLEDADSAAAAAAAGEDDKNSLVEHPEYPKSYLGPVVDTNHDFTTWTAPGGKRFSEYVTGGSPYRITEELKLQSNQVARSRRYHVQKAMKFAWGSYEKYAFGSDELLPQSRQGSNNWGGMGNTLVDSLDTLWLMGLKEEFYRARDWVRDKLVYDHSGMVSVFETTIRSLGGLLSAYDWSGDEAFLTKAQDLGARLFRSFSTTSGIPYGQINLQTGHGSNIGWVGSNAILAEAGTLQIEFRYLAKATGKTEYATTSERVFQLLSDMNPPNGLYPNFITNTGTRPGFGNSKYTFGAMSDSVYEYMLKVWLQGGRKEPLFRNMYDKAIQGMHDELLQTSTPSGLTYIADKNGGHMDHKMDHLVCFMGGLLALGAYTDPDGLQSKRAQRDLKTAKALTYTCYQMYARMNTGISPEYVQFYEGRDFDIGPGAPHYLLRPEVVESFFILNQLTGDPVYREWGWEVFSAIERYCKTDFAYGQLRDVQNTNPHPDDKMESFFLAETLKYLYLLMDPDTEVDVLNKHVFNTEAHPMRIFPLLDQAKASQS